ncbi:MAG: hypothetical protein K5900_04880 [Butyrivibrio sp.]|nr:hypothetical protein [Butyrivibrio sp.]
MDEIRKADLYILNRWYRTGSSNIIVVYSNVNVDKRELFSEFTNDRSCNYYCARSSSERGQQYQWARELRAKGSSIREYPTYGDILRYIAKSTKKRASILWIDNAEYILRVSKNFIGILKEYIDLVSENGKVLVVLSSSNVAWIENSLVSTLGSDSDLIDTFLKIRDLPFKELRRSFPYMSYEDALMTFSVVGGKSKLWNYFDKELSFKGNICKNFLDRYGCLHNEATRLIEDNLRETSVYYSILSQLAAGKIKLNDLYKATSFPRSKIAVYIKNLIQLEIVEKVFSYDHAGHENMMKGVYRICDPMVDFYFTFIYPNISALEQLEPDKFYDMFISASLPLYVSKYFKKICMEYIDDQNEKGNLPFEIEEQGEWIGKLGNIDIIAENEFGYKLLGNCYWQHIVTYEDYEWLLAMSDKAKLKGDYFYLFSSLGFDLKLQNKAASDRSIRLIELNALIHG